MNELLLEIFSEEVPAHMQPTAAEAIMESLVSLTAQVAKEKSLESSFYYTPRRICILIKGLPAEISEQKEEIRGPRVGAPEKAIEGFTRKYGIPKQELIELDGFYWYRKVTPRCSMTNYLGPSIEQCLHSYTWPKSMRWGEYDVKWIRPVRSILCLFNNEIVPVEFGPVKSGNFTFGHRFLSSGKISVSSIQDYMEKLKAAHVVLDPNERREIIIQSAKEFEGKEQITLVEDKALLEEIVNIVENPVVFLGHIDDKYMSLPEELLMITLRSHQKYLMFRDNNSNKLANKFLIVANIKGEEGQVKLGNERVLRARLEDACYFKENDTKRSSLKRLEKLRKLTFHEKIGSVYDKVQGIKSIALNLAGQLKVPTEAVESAATLCKTDLVSEVVQEFPELQGVIGYYYALHEGYEKDIALAIRDHYKPVGPNDNLPVNVTGAIVAIADKLDTLSKLFSIGIKPTGSKDPYALRRAAIGILRILVHWQLDISIASTGVGNDVLEFIEARIASMEETYGIDEQGKNLLYNAVSRK